MSALLSVRIKESLARHTKVSGNPIFITGSPRTKTAFDKLMVEDPPLEVSKRQLTFFDPGVF
jgi:hypothetical protein